MRMVVCQFARPKSVSHAEISHGMQHLILCGPFPKSTVIVGCLVLCIFTGENAVTASTHSSDWLADWLLNFAFDPFEL